MALLQDLADIQVILTRYILSMCFVLGIIGSCFNLLIFCQKRLRSNSCSIYLIATSTFNLLAILFGIIPVLLSSYLSYDLASSSSVFCKIKSYTVHSFLMMSRSSVALACIDRYALCSRDVHIRTLSHRHVAIIALIATSILWLILPIHIIVFVDIQMPGHRCGASGLYLTIYSAYAAIVIAIPLATMIIVSTLTIRNLRHTWTRVCPSMTKTSNRVAIEGFIRYLILDFSIFLNSCSLFYIHLLASKRFREECKQLMVRLFKRRPNKNNRALKPKLPVPNVRHNELQLSEIRSIPDNV